MKAESIWDDWEIVSQIGEGAFGKVFKIERKEFGYVYQAALKIIQIPESQSEIDYVRNAGMDEESITEYFRCIVEEIISEFQLMSKLKGNTNIVSYEDHKVVENIDEFGWKIYIRMELLTPLYEYLKKNTLTVRDVISMGIDICKALEVCQKYNIIHRDIKPENIFISDIGHYKLGDFGIARKLEKATAVLSKKGTYSYMAPEVYKGIKYDSTIDTYSLGIVMYRFLNNNRIPFVPPYPKPLHYVDVENANMLRINGKALEPPCNSKGRLNEIILKACAYNSKERYENPSDMRRALELVLYSEAETEMIYPRGDNLLNAENKYLEKSQTDIQKNIDEKTVYLFEEDNQDNLNINQKSKRVENKSEDVTNKPVELENVKLEIQEKCQAIQIKIIVAIIGICLMVLVILGGSNLIFRRERRVTDNKDISKDIHLSVVEENENYIETNLVITSEQVLGVWEGSYIGMSDNQKKEKKIRLYIGKCDGEDDEQNIQGVAEIEGGEAGYYYWEGKIDFGEGSFSFERKKWLSSNPDHLKKLVFSTLYNPDKEEFRGFIVSDPERTIQFSKAEDNELLKWYWIAREDLIKNFN